MKEFAREDAYRSSSNMFTTYFRSRYAATTANCTARAAGVENASEGITLQLDKTAQPAGAINCYIYLLMDAQLNISDGRLKSVMF